MQCRSSFACSRAKKLGCPIVSCKAMTCVCSQKAEGEWRRQIEELTAHNALLRNQVTACLMLDNETLHLICSTACWQT